MKEAILIKDGAAGLKAPAPPACAVAKLSLADFRSYASLRLALDPAPVVLFGPNGAGKTNVLEALSQATRKTLSHLDDPVTVTA